MTTFDAGRMFAFDLETTGTDPHQCRIVTSALVRIDGGPPQARELLADPGVEIPAAAAEVHGITTEHARAHGRPHDEVLAETIAEIRRAWRDGLTLVAYNAAYDLTVLRTQEPSFTVDGLVFDPLVIDRARDRFRGGKRTLGNVCEHYNVRLDNAHEATADALAAARLAWMMAKKVWPDLAAMDGDELMEYQAVSHFESQRSLREYLRKQGRDVSDFRITAWPMDARAATSTR
ncbi:3'-5' exonuclease [Corynebacterium hansenii]|uniref:3'-5' exonuclease n=1 Tax=Corynebacterium hansenii TaxID=394964 RepID=A0ABV7ZJ35_9CORY|nr:3'-5' exonuclease [Corynebacterium hansenii]WJY99602.1 DNA polymerase III subunit epsilon [Corynebacterium hansenii]